MAVKPTTNETIIAVTAKLPECRFVQVTRGAYEDQSCWPSDQRLGEVFNAHGAIASDLACDTIVVAFEGTHRNDEGWNEDRCDSCAGNSTI